MFGARPVPTNTIPASMEGAESARVLMPVSVTKPIMLASDEICDGIGYPVELVLGSQQVVLDFPKRTVREAIPDEKFRYGFAIPAELVRTVLRDKEPDWVNTIFLSTRFRAWRVGGYNEYQYTFFKCLTGERQSPWTAGRFSDDARI